MSDLHSERNSSTEGLTRKMIMSKVYVIGIGTTRFKRWAKRTYQDLAWEAFEACLVDSGLNDGLKIDHLYFGSCASRYWKQANIVGQTCVAPWIEQGHLAPSIRIHNVEGGCATGSIAAYQMMGDLQSGRSQVGLALGVEKTFLADQPSKIPDLFAAGIDQHRLEEAYALYQKTAQEIDQAFDPHPHRIILVDIAALHAKAHMQKYGITQRDVAHVASKNHMHGSLNPNAQYQNAMSVDEILQDQSILFPLTRSMCAPISDGSSAILMVSESYLRTLPDSIQKRAVQVVDSALQVGVMAEWTAQSPTERAAHLLYKQAQVTPQDIGFAELHDSTAYSEILHLEELGFYAPGQAAFACNDGQSHRTGHQPINPSGGLISKGHPLGASGLMMIHEVVSQLRGEAGQRQLTEIKSSYALTQNGGGLIGFQEAVSVVTLFKKDH